MNKHLGRVSGLAVGTAALLALTSVTASANSTTLYNPTALSPSGTNGAYGQNGTAYAVAIGGGSVFVGGSFTAAVKNKVTAPRTNLMAVSESNGVLGPLVADTNATVRALATDGTWLYVGGDFTTIQGVAVNRLARINVGTRLVDPNFKPNVPRSVRGLALGGGGLYVVGDFGTIGTTTRKYAAALDPSTGGVLPFNPNLSGKAYAVEVKGSIVYLAGAFTTVNGGTARNHLAAVDATSGTVTGPTFASVGDVLLALSVSDDGSQVFGAGGGGFNSAAAWDATTGRRQWADRANGDVQAVEYSHGNVYFGFHDGYNGNTTLRLLAADAITGAVEPGFMPVSSGYPGVEAITADGSRLVSAGKFPKMGGATVKGLSIHVWPH
jgi:hypothetical protein